MGLRQLHRSEVQELGGVATRPLPPCGGGRICQSNILTRVDLVILRRFLLAAIAALALLGSFGPAQADEFGDAVAGLAADGFAEKGQAIAALGKSGDPRAIPILQ